MRIAFLTPWDVNDSSAWSGIVKPAYRALARKIEIRPVVYTDKHAAIDRLLARCYGEFAGATSYLPSIGVASSRKASRDAVHKLSRERFDAVLAFGALSALYLHSFPLPVVQFCDATAAALIGHYPMFSNLSRLSVRQFSHIEKRGLENTNAFLASSPWVANLLTRDLGVPKEKIYTAPAGPGIDSSGGKRGPFSGFGLKILLVASDWERKGGARVLQIVREMRKINPHVRLTLVGRKMSDNKWLTSHERMDRKSLSRLYLSHDILIEMTIANTGGVLVADAASAGIPVIANAIGAMPSLVGSAGTGMLVSPAADDADIARQILDTADATWLQQVSLRSRKVAAESWNWDAWSRSAISALEHAISDDRIHRESF
nr:glycosyltransferase family 4 protein [Actinomyces sp.]